MNTNALDRRLAAQGFPELYAGGQPSIGHTVLQREVVAVLRAQGPLTMAALECRCDGFRRFSTLHQAVAMLMMAGTVESRRGDHQTWVYALAEGQ